MSVRLGISGLLSEESVSAHYIRRPRARANRRRARKKADPSVKGRLALGG